MNDPVRPAAAYIIGPGNEAWLPGDFCSSLIKEAKLSEYLESLGMLTAQYRQILIALEIVGIKHRTSTSQPIPSSEVAELSDWVSTTELARQIFRDSKIVRNAIDRGELPAAQHGRQKWILRTDAERWKRSRQGPPADPTLRTSADPEQYEAIPDVRAH